MVKVVPASDIGGAIIQGVDPRRAITPDDFGRINQAFLDHLVVVFKEAPLDPHEFCRLGQHFGELQPHVAKRYRHPEVPEIVLMTNQDKDGNFDPAGAERGVGWHSDLAYEQTPAKATLLHAIHIPDRGGNTRFANMYRAWEEMPTGLKERVDGRFARFRYGGRKRVNLAAISAADQQSPDVVHPLIRVHPETGRKAVYANPYHALRVIGMPQQASDELLDELFEWCAQPRFQWEHVWSVGDTIAWENRSAWHSGNLDYDHRQRRTFLRTTVRGTPTIDAALAERLLAA
jgi:alpha-ketoglutarate-dependent taurine dioxygenase